MSFCFSEMGDVKASIAALTFILSSAAKYDCEDETLSNELQQLGLPKGQFGSNVITCLLH